jgi:hypothetical protein
MPRRTCLGTRVLALGKMNDSGDEGKAALLVECEDGDHDGDPVLEIKLSTGTSSYGCTISPSETFLAFRGGDSENGETGDDDEASKILALGRLFLRIGGDDDEDHRESPGTIHHEASPAQNWFQNLTISFQSETTNNNNNISDERFHDETTKNCENHRRDLVLVIHENLANGMKRTILRRKLELIVDDEHELSYCRSVGDALNRALSDAEQLKSGRALWKKTAEDLGKMQQGNKDALLANFTKLRNHMVQHHQAQLEELKRVHETEKEFWAATTTTTTTNNATFPAKKAPRKHIIKKEVDIADQLFAQEDALALAEGRKLGASINNNNNNSGNNNTARRKAVLKADEAADMVKIIREGEAFQRNRNDARKRKRQQTESNNQEDRYQLKSETGDAFDRTKHKPMAVGRDRTKDGKPTPSLVKSSNSNVRSFVVDDDIGVAATRGNPPPRGTTFRAKQNNRDMQHQTEPPARAYTIAPVARKSTSTESLLLASKETSAADDGSTSSESSWTLR